MKQNTVIECGNKSSIKTINETNMPSKPSKFRFHTSVKDYLELKDMYWTAYTNGSYWDKKQKEWVEESEFKKRYALPLSLHANSGTSSDTRKQWMAN